MNTNRADHQLSLTERAILSQAALRNLNAATSARDAESAEASAPTVSAIRGLAIAVLLASGMWLGIGALLWAFAR